MSATTLRNPAVAGRFYPGDPGELRTQLHSFLSPSQAEPVRALGCIAPHAGYMYSGHVAGALFARIEIPRCCIVLCPNHTGQGQLLAMMAAGAWKTPLGDVPIDETLARALQRQFPLLHDDFAAHRSEHAAEVELPFLQLRQPQLRFLPIALGTSRFEPLEHLGKALAAVIAEQNHPILIVASSDMNHYESDAVTRVKDHRALEPILALDPRGLYDVITEHDISMCGFGPAVAMLTAARESGATSAELVKYATSGDVSGDRDMVVGYAGVLVK
ncbi:MAG TPA: AmmeMemoRadiSam system protein B [Candidatus Sulfotelmatobacter sp.]|nr:AmmeMemoRadiSam system protein B [Candidatus Sulfotelmatobacter sp.]